MAAMAVPVTLSAECLFEHTTMVVTIKETRRFRVRIAMAKAMMILTSLVLGCDIEFDTRSPSPPSPEDY
jgi:hypothetical protein